MTNVPLTEEVTPPSIAVAIVCICSAAHLARCLAALRVQERAPRFEVLVSHDPNLANIDAVARQFPEAHIFCTAHERTPLELASSVLRACDADVLLLTEDHCIPARNWVRSMLAARAPGRAAIGGRVEIRPGASPVDWAFYFVDFFRYADPVQEGPSPTLTVCNVAYERDKLDAVRPLWQVRFEEPAVHNALRERFGPLWLIPDSAVTMRRKVSLPAALAERYAFGRVFGHTRIAHVSFMRRCFLAVAAPALPVLLLVRMATKAMRAPALARAFLRAFFPLAAMVACWSWGEWLGYLTGRQPRSLVLARELPPAGEAREAGNA